MINLKYLFILFLFSCTTYKNGFSARGDYRTAIKNAIIDFSETSPNIKKYDVFSISYDEIDGQIIKITIIGKDKKRKFYIFENDPGRLPDSYIERKGKLFYWWKDDKNLVSQDEILKKLTEYGMIEHNPDTLVITHYDGHEVDFYYFCKNDLTLFKKENQILNRKPQIYRVNKLFGCSIS